MDLTINFLFLSFSIAILIWGADKFVDNASILAKKIGVHELTIGLTVIALGTSAPEIFVGISSVLNDNESIAMGAVVGSNISNIALIFGVSCIGALYIPRKTPAIQFFPFLIASFTLGYALYDLYISIFESLLLLIVFFYFLFITFKNRLSNENESMDMINQKKNLSLFFLLIIGLSGLIIGSHYTVIYAEKIALLLNISELIIGLTVIAIGTSLPELATTISSIMKKKTDMVVGNVIGSNVFNITLVVPIIGLFSNVYLEEVLLQRDFSLMIIASLLFVLIVFLNSSKIINTISIRFIGFILVISYVVYLLLLSNLI